MQKILNADQISEFYHDGFVQQQMEHFKKLITHCKTLTGRVVTDIGGGCGYFAQVVHRELGIAVRVVDMDPVSIQSAKKMGLEANFGDALNPDKHGDEAVVCFNLILHHLVGKSESDTAALQRRALVSWHNTDALIFINEYIYESWISNFSGWLIYQITKNNILSGLAKSISYFLPSLRANTFGVGVRFRSDKEWRDFFINSGFKIVDEVKGNDELISLPRRLLLIKKIRRNSFLLESA
jgi:hypothetical protein